MSPIIPDSKEDPRTRTDVPEDEDDYTSSSGSSSDESEDEESDGDEMVVDSKPTSTTTKAANGTSIPSISGRPKPQIHRMEGGADLLSRLSSFLPKMKAANEDLEKEIAAGRGDDMVLDSVNEDGKDYIEMVCWIAFPPLIILFFAISSSIGLELSLTFLEPWTGSTQGETRGW